MRRSLLDVLRCPYCGGALHPADQADAQRKASFGVLCCACCAYPVIDGIPVMRLSDETSQAIAAIERGQHDEARSLVLDLPPDRRDTFDDVREDPAVTFADAVRRVLPDGEGDYYVLRLGDPTFLVADAVVRAIWAMLPVGSGRLVDVCGGCGHLSWTLASLRRPGVSAPVLLDRSFWRLSLAARLVVPGADVAVCDANVPLPLASGSAGLAVCNDAVHYVWGKRLLATEMQRIAGPRGWCAWTHVHSSLGDNASAGNTLTPAQYAALFDGRSVMLSDERDLLEAAVSGNALPWRSPDEGSACASANAISLVAARHGGDLMLHGGAPVGGDGVMQVNPLYTVERSGDTARLMRQFPSADYAAEFGPLCGHLPETVEVAAAALEDLEGLARSRADLTVRRVLLRVPPRYL
jgi:uncharacterized protein YbaR (Trm112 family)